MLKTDSPMQHNLKIKRILLAHSNSGAQMKDWHNRRELSARRLGYDLATFCLTDLHPYTIFPYLDKKWRHRDRALMKLYDLLGEKIAAVDIFIHFNGALIHPEFLAQFRQLKIYHCADDPEASPVLSRPVAHAYDIHAISNPSCIEMYRSWGCKRVFFWPLGAFHYDDEHHGDTVLDRHRDIPLTFVGCKLGTPVFRFIPRIPLINKMSWPYYKKRFFNELERAFPTMHGYGGGWSRGRIDDADIPDLYRRTQIGINVHNSLGPINGRLYDLAAFGVCQICDNKRNLDYVFAEGKEIIGFETNRECVELIRYYISHTDEARAIGEAAHNRYMTDYTIDSIWTRFFENVQRALNVMAY